MKVGAPRTPYRLSPTGDAFKRLRQLCRSLSSEECREIVLDRWGNGITKVFPHFEIHEVYHISLLPIVAKRCGVSVSWILTGKEFGTAGGLDFPDHECKELAGVLKDIKDEDIPVIEDLLDCFAPYISDFPTIDPLAFISREDFKSKSEVFYERLTAIDKFKQLPARISEDIARKYGLNVNRKSDKKNMLYLREKPSSDSFYGVEGLDEMRFMALAEDMSLPLGLFFDWEETDFYTGRPRCDMIIARYAMVLQEYRSVISEVCSWLAQRGKEVSE